jgi:hypothetical protein
MAEHSRMIAFAMSLSEGTRCAVAGTTRQRSVLIEIIVPRIFVVMTFEEK